MTSEGAVSRASSVTIMGDPPTACHKRSIDQQFLSPGWSATDLKPQPHSVRSATIGSMRAALRAGMKAARQATHRSTTTVPANVNGSKASIP